MSFGTLVLDALRESRRKKLFWVVLWICVATALSLIPFQFRPSGLHFFDHRLSDGWQLPAAFRAQLPDPLIRLGPEQAAGMTLMLLATMVLGWAGIVLWVSATASFVPDFLRRGRCDLTLARPVSRWQILAAKYVGGLVFVAVQAGVFVVLTCLVVSLNSGRFFAGYLLIWPLIVHQFACLFAVSVLIGLLSRSTVFAILGTLSFSMTCFGVSTLRPHIEQFGLSGTWAGGLLEAFYWVLPKPQDVTLIAQQWMWPDALAGGTFSIRDAQILASASPAASLTTSLILPAVLLAIAVWRFRKMDC